MDLIGVATAAAGELRTAQLRNLYRGDFIAWQADVLGIRTYEKMQGITETALFSDLHRTAIKSANGTSKTYSAAAMVLWTGSVHEPGESLAIMSAPSAPQIEKGLVKYMKSFKDRARRRGNTLPGRINEQLEWVFDGPEGKIYLAYGRTPAAGTEVSTFQGIRAESGKTFMFFDEAGGLSKGMWTAAEAIITGADSRLIAIGNPDEPGTEWQSIFEDKKYDGEFNLFTLSAFDLPTLTGEVVYPDDPEMEEQIHKALTQRSWVEHKQRIWGVKDARYQSKVLGEFPKDGGNGFFPTSAITKSFGVEIEDDLSVPVVLGVDIARMGLDESVVYSNRGGRVRLEDSWGKMNTYESSERVFEIAKRLQPVEIRIDGTGVGAGVWDNLVDNPDFAGPWVVIGIEGASSSPDLRKWLNKRAYIHDSTRTQMIEGEIDIDIEDTELKEQLTLITYKFAPKGGIQIAAKDDMKTEMGGSPDRADAFIYSTCDLSPWTENPLNEFRVGERVAIDPEEMLESPYVYGFNSPL